MGHGKTDRRRGTKAALSALLAALLLTALCATAQAAPTHLRKEALDLTALNHACGAAVDSKGDLYASSAGDSKVNVYNPSHVLLTEIADVNTPCGLAVTSTGVLYVSEKATGEVVSFKPNKYPFEGAPTYGSREVVDASGKAKGIAVDGYDDGLYVAEGDRVSSYVNELQIVGLENTTGGTFKLKFEGSEETAAIPFNASAAELKAALEALSTIGAGNVEVTKPSAFFVFFAGKFAHTDVPALSGDKSGLTGPNPAFVQVRVVSRSQGRSAQFGEGVLSEASGVAAFTQPHGSELSLEAEHFLWVADAQGLLEDGLYLFRSQDAGVPKFEGHKVTGAATPDGSFGFGPSGAYLAADPGNRDTAGSSEPGGGNSTVGKCKALGEQACTAGHLFLYDAEHKALDEFDASGVYLDRTANAAFANAEPTAIAIDRSGAAEKDGTLYVTAGPGAGAKALAFGPLKAPSRAILGEPLSHKEVKKARSVAVDSHGDAYVATGSAAAIHIYSPSGAEITAIGDAHKPRQVAVDSTGTVYVVDENSGLNKEREATYYTPSKYPPDNATTYERRSEPIITSPKCPDTIGPIKTIAVNPGPGAGKDHLFVLCGNKAIRIYDSAANGSSLVKGEFGQSLLETSLIESIAVNGVTGTVYLGENPHAITGIDEATEELVVRFENTGFSSGKLSSPFLAVDESNGHIVEFDGINKKAREYDGAGSFVAEFGTFTEGLASVPFGVAIDNACTLHEPEPLSGKACEEYDPANGTLYVAFDDTSASNPPYDVNAFGLLKYGPGNEKFALSIEKPGTGSGKVTSTPAGIDCGGTCSAEFEEGKAVTLKAEAASGSEFVKWSRACSGSGECKVTISEAKSVEAEFKLVAKAKFKLSVKTTGTGSGIVESSPAGINCDSECSAEYEEGTEVTLSASAESGSKFTGWSGSGCSGTATCEVTMSSAKEVTATFTLEQHLLTVTKKGTGSGTVTSSPAGINCGETCTASFDHGTTVTLAGTPGAKAKAVAWSGCDSVNGENKCLVAMSAAKEVTATFDLEPAPKFKLSVKTTGTGSGIVESSPAGINCGSECSAEYEEGTKVTLTQSAGSESEFREWGGACSGKDSCKVTMSAAKEVTAFFSHAKQILTVKQEGTGAGTVSSKPKAINCAGACTEAQAALYKGTTVLLAAKAMSGSNLGGFSGCETETKPTEFEGTCTVKMSAAKEVKVTYGLTAKAILNPVVLSFAKGSGTGKGRVKASGLTCEADCTSTKVKYTSGDGVKKLPAKVVFKEAPALGSSFSGWTGCESNPTPSECVVATSSAREVTASFNALPTKTLTVAQESAEATTGTGTISSKPKGIKCASACTQAVAALPEGTTVVLTAKAAAGSKLNSWSGCEEETKSEAEGTCTVKMSAAKEVKATFGGTAKAILSPKALRLAKAGTGYGTVKATGLTCEAACASTEVKYTGGDGGKKLPAKVTLKATSQAGSDPVSWTGCESNPTPSECVVTMATGREVVARFEE